MKYSETLRIGTAGWSVPSVAKGEFRMEGSQLQRYSAFFSCIEINSSFYRPHRVETCVRWAATVPDDFRFAVKAFRGITHERRLRNAHGPLDTFFEQIGAMGPALGPVLFQLPPSLKFDRGLAETFLGDLRDLFAGEVTFEPRHSTWFDVAADERLLAHRVGRVGADPAPAPEAASPGGWPSLRYWRLHGSPQMYHTPYGEDRLRSVAEKLSPDD